MEKKLYRSNKDKKLAGVCGGLAEYINLDPTVVRLLWVLFSCMGAGILVYIVAAIIMPEPPAEENKVYTETTGETVQAEYAQQAEQPQQTEDKTERI